MGLLKEIDEQAKGWEFGQWLKELEEFGADMEHPLLAEAVYAKIEMLNEIGRGDYAAHMGMAQSAGIKGHETRPGVQKAFEPRQGIGLQRREHQGAVPEEGDLVRDEETKKVYKIAGPVENNIANLDDPKATFPGAGGDTVKDVKNQLTLIPLKGGRKAWAWNRNAKQELPQRGRQF